MGACLLVSWCFPPPLTDIVLTLPTHPPARHPTTTTIRGYDTYTPHRSVVYHDYNHNVETAPARYCIHPFID